MPTTATKRYLTVRETIAAYSIGNTKLYALIGNGSIKTALVGRRRLIEVASIDDYLSRSTEAA